MIHVASLIDVASVNDTLRLAAKRMGLKPYVVQDDAPSTFEDVVKERKLIVWGGASDNTIYQDASVNQNEFILSYIKG